MKVGNYEVKNVTRGSAEVGCTKVTKAEVEAVLAAMKAAPELEVKYYIQFSYNHNGVWGRCTSELLGGNYSLKEAFEVIEKGKIAFPNNAFRVVAFQ